MDRIKRSNHLSLATCFAACCCLLTSITTLAQDEDAAQQRSGYSEATELEEITVTARKRVENLQDVALSVSAMGQKEIQTAFAVDIRDLIYISPNTVIDDTNQGPGGVAAAYIRGVGVSEVEKNFDPAVGVVVDGIFRGTMTGSITRAIDLERVEVARGPQGTLFGRNTIGGVIIMEHSKPTGETGGKFRASYGDYETAVIDGIFNFGLGDQLAVKLSGAYRDQGEGYFTNLVTGRKDGQSEYTAGGINIMWSPAENVEIEWTYLIERTDQDNPPLLNVGQPGQLFCIAWNWCSADTSTPVSGDRYLNLSAYGNDVINPFPGSSFTPPGYEELRGPYEATFDADTNQLEVRWDLNDDYRIDYIIGSWKTEELTSNDWDAVPEILFHTDRPAEYDQVTHELRLTYDSGGKLAYTVGGYYWDSDYEVRLLSYIGFFPLFGVGEPGDVFTLPQTVSQTSKSKAIFFEGDYSFTDQWTLTLGGRYTEDKKTTRAAGIVNTTGQEKWDKFTPKVALKYQLNDDSMIYGLYSNGYRAGGFNGRVDSVEQATIPYAPETVDNFELGYRSEWAGRSLIFNATAFYMDYQDKQEEVQQASETSGTGQVTTVFNAATATMKGVEIELMWLAAEGFTLRANLGLLDAGYDEFLINSGTVDDPVFTDFSELDLRRAPSTTFSLVGNYEWQVGAGQMMVQAGWRFLGSHEVDFANKPELHNSSQNLIDASINYYYQDWYFSLFGRNLAKEDGYQIGFDVAGIWSYAAPRAPRTYGLEVGLRF